MRIFPIYVLIPFKELNRNQKYMYFVKIVRQKSFPYNNKGTVLKAEIDNATWKITNAQVMCF